MRPHREPGIRRDARGRIQAYVRAGGQLRFKRFPVDTSAGDRSPVAPRHPSRVAVDAASPWNPRCRHRALPAADCGSAEARGGASPATGMVGGAPRPAPSSRHHPGRRAGRARPTCGGPTRRQRATTTARLSSRCTGRSMAVLPRIRSGTSSRSRVRPRKRAGSRTTRSAASWRPCRIREAPS